MNFDAIVQECQAALRLYGADDSKQIKMSVNMAYAHLASLRSWAPLRRKTTISFAGHDSANSVLLPGDLLGIDAVWGGTTNPTTHVEYMATDQSSAENSDEYGDNLVYRWFYTQPEADAFAILTNVNLAQGSNIFSCDNWSDTYIGEYAMIGSELGVYKLTAANTIFPRWYGPQITGGPQGVIQVRPAGTKRFSVIDYDGVFSSAVSVTLYYWVMPPVLYASNQPILLPSYKPLELLSIINVLGLRDRKESIASIYRAEYDKALAEMESLNSDFQSPSIPLDRFGDRRSFTGK